MNILEVPKNEQNILEYVQKPKFAISGIIQAPKKHEKKRNVTTTKRRIVSPYRAPIDPYSPYLITELID